MFDHHSNDPVFNVKAMARQTGVAAATLRAWERRYGVPSPPRTDSGYRLYSARDAAIIRWLKMQIENGMSISQAVQLLRSIESQPHDGRQAEAHSRRIEPGVPSSYQRLHDDIVAAAVEFDEEHIEYALSEAFSLFPVEDVCLQLIQPVLVTLGDRWHAGEVNISVEHFATNIMRRRLLALMASSPLPTRTARIISACAPDEYHELGILMISLFLRRRGYHIIYLGQNISSLRLQEALAKAQPDMLLLSASGLVAAANLLDVTQALQATGTDAGLIVAFGGRAFSQLPELQRRVPGLYVGDDARTATMRVIELLADALTDAVQTRPRRHATSPSHHSPSDASAASHTSLTQDALATFRRHGPEIVAVAARLIPHLSEDAHDDRRVVEALEHLLQLIDAAIRFGEPGVLSDRSNWAWDALPPDGIAAARLGQCAQALAEAANTVLPAAQSPALQPYFQALQLAFTHPQASQASQASTT